MSTEPRPETDADADADADVDEEDDEPLLELDEVSVSFKQGGLFAQYFRGVEVTAVDDVSIAIEETDVLALVGESGCGKTTLGKTAIGLQEPTEGEVRYRGQDIWEAKRDNQPADGIEFEEIRKSLQIIHQDPASSLNPSRRIRGSLADPLKIHKPDMSANERDNRIVRLLDRMGMTPAQDYANRYPHQLSGGEKQRVALGRALLVNPDLILADEAVSALDVSLRVEMMDLMLELQDLFDTSYLFISHDLSNARYLAEHSDGRIGVMYMGNIVEIGTPEEILYNPQHPYTKVMLWSTPVIDPELAKELVAEEPPLRSIDVPDPTEEIEGCHFHTRCPYAHEVCQTENPDLIDGPEGGEARCYRADPDHEYWQSPSVDPELEEETEIL